MGLFVLAVLGGAIPLYPSRGGGCLRAFCAMAAVCSAAGEALMKPSQGVRDRRMLSGDRATPCPVDIWDFGAPAPLVRTRPVSAPDFISDKFQGFWVLGYGG